MSPRLYKFFFFFLAVFLQIFISNSLGHLGSWKNISHCHPATLPTAGVSSGRPGRWEVWRVLCRLREG